MRNLSAGILQFVARGDRFHRKAALGLVLLALVACQPAPHPSPEPVATKAGPPAVTRPANLRLAVGEWSPYMGETLPHYGCDAWVITAAFAEEGIRVEYTFMPWSRSLKRAAEGGWEGTAEWADTPEHRKEFYLSADYLSEQEWTFFSRADEHFQWNSMDDLMGMTVGVTSGYVYSDLFAEAENNGTVQFESASSDLANFQKLLAGRIDAFPMERNVGKAMLRENFTEEERARVEVQAAALEAFRPYLLLSKAILGNEDRMARFDRSFARLKTSGEYAEIMQSCLPQE